MDMSDKGRFYNNEQIAERLGVSIFEVRRRHREGSMPRPTKTKGPNGALLWDADVMDVYIKEHQRERTPAPFTAEEAAIVFEAFERGESDIDCVVKLKIGPHAVKAIRYAYAELKDALYISPAVLKQINSLGLDGPFPLAEEGDLLRFMSAQTKVKCAECHKRSPIFCKGCVQSALKATREKALSKAEGTDEL